MTTTYGVVVVIVVVTGVDMLAVVVVNMPVIADTILVVLPAWSIGWFFVFSFVGWLQRMCKLCLYFLCLLILFCYVIRSIFSFSLISFLFCFFLSHCFIHLCFLFSFFSLLL